MSPVQPPLPAVPPPTRALPLVPPPSYGSTTTSGSTAVPSGEGTAGSTAVSGSTPAGPVPTGPVDWMPMPPEPGAPAPDPRPAPVGGTTEPGAGGETVPTGNGTARRRVRLRVPRPPRTPRGGRGAAAGALGAVALLLLELGLLVHEGGTTLWARVPLWSAFATVAALVGLAAAAGLRAAAPLRDRAWTGGAGGFAGLAVFWVLVVLPTADTDRGFVLTASLACLGGSLWLTASRGRTAPVDGAAVDGTAEQEQEPAPAAMGEPEQVAPTA